MSVKDDCPRGSVMIHDGPWFTPPPGSLIQDECCDKIDKENNNNKSCGDQQRKLPPKPKSQDIVRIITAANYEEREEAIQQDFYDRLDSSLKCRPRIPVVPIDDQSPAQVKGSKGKKSGAPILSSVDIERICRAANYAEREESLIDDFCKRLDAKQRPRIPQIPILSSYESGYAQIPKK